MKKYYYLMQSDEAMFDDPLVAIVTNENNLIKIAFSNNDLDQLIQDQLTDND
jgi:hypothetical protein